MNRRSFLGWLAASAAFGYTTRGWSSSQAATSWQPRYQEGLPIELVDVEQVPQPVAQALAVTRRHILAHCTSLEQPNAVNHGLRALGRQLPFGYDDPFRTVLETFTKQSYIEGQMLLEVPVQNEGHRHALLKTLIEKQCELDLEFTVDGQTHTFADYIRSARALHSFDLQSLSLDEQSWAILAFTRVTDRRDARWVNLHGQVQDLERVIDQTAAGLQADTRLIRSVDLSSDDLPRNCAAFALACGGLHMLYAVAAALSCGYGTAARRSAFATSMRTHMRRFTYDLKVIEQVELLNKERGQAERAAVRALDGRIKFLGHSLEIVGLVDQFDLYELSGQERDLVARGRQQLCEWIIETDGVNLGRHQADRVLFDSLLTGFCHAYNGLRMSPA